MVWLGFPSKIPGGVIGKGKPTHNLLPGDIKSNNKAHLLIRKGTRETPGYA